jgi:hypothetical protein
MHSNKLQDIVYAFKHQQKESNETDNPAMFSIKKWTRTQNLLQLGAVHTA